ncbi:hypothetical protein Cco03nite_36910 [Catellatospora coxensis]|uniref:Uncharacterized protein n=1 Tax=Catellatospora coxensis TaxID=310354 RepID=A0A8J3P7E5_9ACTN|nr:hypothetical protein Cco03nite_36910 [Catellatospora coxensis]
MPSTGNTWWVAAADGEAAADGDGEAAGVVDGTAVGAAAGTKAGPAVGPEQAARVSAVARPAATRGKRTRRPYSRGCPATVRASADGAWSAAWSVWASANTPPPAA